MKCRAGIDAAGKTAEIPRMTRLWKHRGWLAAAAVAGLLALILGCEAWIARNARGRCLDDARKVPAAHAAVVLGTSARLPDGRVNLFFRPRLEAAAALYHAGRVQALIVSGDNSRPGYDEPSEMKAMLVSLGVPEARIVCDFAGFRTLDTVVRAREVFGQSRVVFVSQPFHNARALYLADAFGIEAWGLNARDVPVSLSLKTFLREKLACVKAVLDVHLLHTRPRFLGAPVSVP